MGGLGFKTYQASTYR